jgi:hypothetical protein
MLRIVRYGAVVALAVGAVLGGRTPAMADGYGRAQCPEERPRPSCDIVAGTAGQNGGSTNGTDGNGSNEGATGGGTGFDARMRIVGPSPETLARQARARLDLPEAVIRLNPPADQLVNLPIWLTLDRSSWTVQSATAAVPGVSVTATARPVQAIWSMGDGGSVVCNGPGTEWKPGTDPSAASPDCGYTYRRSSIGAAGGRFAVSVAVTWVVTWAGAGQAGLIPGLTTTGAMRVAVQESQAVIS